jgi:hypothetical protein
VFACLAVLGHQAGASGLRVVVIAGQAGDVHAEAPGLHEAEISHRKGKAGITRDDEAGR